MKLKDNTSAAHRMRKQRNQKTGQRQIDKTREDKWPEDK